MVASAASLTATCRRPLRDGKARHVSPRTPPRDDLGVVAPHLHHVYDLRYIDSLILRDRDPTVGGDSVMDERPYYAQDAHLHVTALVDTTGGTGGSVERYAYTPYGERAVFTASWTPLTATVFDNAVSYTGQRLDAESGLHHFRNRFYSADLGRFITRDPLGYVDGKNFYAGHFANGRGVDPTGLQVVHEVPSRIRKKIYWRSVGTYRSHYSSGWTQWKSNYDESSYLALHDSFLHGTYTIDKDNNRKFSTVSLDFENSRVDNPFWTWDTGHKIRGTVSDKVEAGEETPFGTKVPVCHQCVVAVAHHTVLLDDERIAITAGAGINQEWKGINVNVSANKTMTTSTLVAPVYYRATHMICTDGVIMSSRNERDTTFGEYETPSYDYEVISAGIGAGLLYTGSHQYRGSQFVEARDV